MGQQKVEVIQFLPGQRIDSMRLPIELGVARDAKKRSSLMVRGAPAGFRKGRRVMPWTSERPIVGMFGGDGESIDFSAGPEHDWRTVPFDLGDNPEQDEARLVDAAEQERTDLNKRASYAALMRAYDSHMQPPGGTLAQSLTALTWAAVLGVLVLAFLSSDVTISSNFLEGM